MLKADPILMKYSDRMRHFVFCSFVSYYPAAISPSKDCRKKHIVARSIDAPEKNLKLRIITVFYALFFHPSMQKIIVNRLLLYILFTTKSLAFQFFFTFYLLADAVERCQKHSFTALAVIPKVLYLIEDSLMQLLLVL